MGSTKVIFIENKRMLCALFVANMLEATSYIADVSQENKQADRFCNVVIDNWNTFSYMSQLLLLGKFEYGGGLIFKVVLEC